MSQERLVSEVPSQEHHELKETWVFWYLIPNLNKTEDWSTYLKQIGEFHSVEDFWGILNSVEPPLTLPTGCRYYIFKRGVRPLWEDEKNQNGYQVFCSIPCNIGPEPRREAQQKWEDLAATVVGGKLAEYDLVNGVEFNCKKRQTNVGVWTKAIEDQSLEALKLTLKETIDATSNFESTKIVLK